MSFKDEANYLKIENMQSDMKQIDFYALGEHELFGKLSSRLKNIRSYYVSPNNSAFTAMSASLLKDREPIKKKRKKYNDVLQRNIDLYLQGRSISMGIFSKSGDKDE